MPPTRQWFQREVTKLSTNPNCFCHRERVSAAQINAGYVLLPPARLGRYEISDITMIAIGGAASGATSVDIKGTYNGAVVVILSAAVAALTRSTVARAGAANMTVLADGASFVPMDVNTGITIIKNGADLATATHIDVILWYGLDNF